MLKKIKQPAWLIPKKVGKLKPMSTRNVVKRHLKEWNFDDEEIEYPKMMGMSEKKVKEINDFLKRREEEYED